MRVVAGEQDLVPADPLHHVDHVRGVFRLLHRLGRDPEMLAQIFGGSLPQVRDLVLQALPALVEAPAERGKPAEARLDQHDLERRIALEHPFEDQTRHRRLERGRVLGDLLDVERGPAGIAHGPAARAEHVHPDRQTRLDRGLEDRPVAALAQKLAGAAQEQHVREAAVAGALADLLHRQLGILIGDHHRRLQPWLTLVPALELILVARERHGGAELVVLLALSSRRERVHHAPLDPVEIEMLLAHEVEVARGEPASGRPGVAPRGERLAFGIGKALHVAVALPLPVGLQIVPPALAEMGAQILERALGVDITVEHADPHFGTEFGLPDFHVHGVSSSGPAVIPGPERSEGARNP